MEDFVADPHLIESDDSFMRDVALFGKGAVEAIAIGAKDELFGQERLNAQDANRRDVQRLQRGRYMSFRIEISPDQEDVTLHVIGRFDLAVGFAFWQYCEPERRRHKRYLFNLTGVSDLRDSGIGWLLMFSKRARALGARLTLVNGTPGFEQRCIAAGIPMEAFVSPAKPASMAVRFERDLAPRV